MCDKERAADHDEVNTARAHHVVLEEHQAQKHTTGAEWHAARAVWSTQAAMQSEDREA